MIKDNVVSQVSKATGFRQTTVSAIVDSLLDTVSYNLANGESVQFAGFGTFYPKKCAARTGRNPHTNTEVKIPPRIVPSFRPGKWLKAAVIKDLQK